MSLSILSTSKHEKSPDSSTFPKTESPVLEKADQDYALIAYELLLSYYGTRIDFCKLFYNPIEWLCSKTYGEGLTKLDLQNMAAKFTNQPGMVAALGSILSNPPIPYANQAVDKALKYKLGTHDNNGKKHPALLALEHLDVDIEFANHVTNYNIYECALRLGDHHPCLGTTSGNE